MEAVPTDKDCAYYMKCLAFILGIGMDVLHNYFEQKILKDMDLYLFVEKNKHYLYHAYNASIKCCGCSASVFRSNSAKRSINRTQFEILFDIGLPTNLAHYQTGSNKQLKQDCLCRFDAKRSIEVDCMDITLMSAVIKACFLDNNISIHGNPKDLETIRNTRNYLAHSSERRISKTEFTSILVETEQAILGIANTIGKYFAKETKRKIEAFKNDDLSFVQIKRIIESSVDGVTKELNKLLEEQMKLPMCIQQIQDQFSKLLRQHKDELKVDFENLRFEVRQFAHLDFSSSTQEATLDIQDRVSSTDTEAFRSIENTMETVVSPSQQSDTVADDSNVQKTEKGDRIAEGKKCRVEWKFETPGVWNLIEMQERLLHFSRLFQQWVEIQFVYVGSLVIKGFVQKQVLDDRDKMRNLVHSFLEKFVKVCEISTDVSIVIKVDLMVELNELDFEEIKTKTKMSIRKDKTTCIFCRKSFDCKNCQQKDKIIFRLEEEKYEEEIKLMILKAEQEINGVSTEHTPESGNVSSSRIYYARIEYAVKSVIPNMIKDLLELLIPSKNLGEKLKHSRRFQPRLLAAEWEQIELAPTAGYRDFDMRLVTRIIDHCCGEYIDQTLHEEFKIYKRYSHDILHKLNLLITSRTEFNESFDDFNYIAKSFENVLRKDQDELVSQLEALRIGSMDSYLDD